MSSGSVTCSRFNSRVANGNIVGSCEDSLEISCVNARDRLAKLNSEMNLIGTRGGTNGRTSRTTICTASNNIRDSRLAIYNVSLTIIANY